MEFDKVVSMAKDIEAINFSVFTQTLPQEYEIHCLSLATPVSRLLLKYKRKERFFHLYFKKYTIIMLYFILNESLRSSRQPL